MNVQLEVDVEEDDKGPTIIESEVRAALNELKARKAVGVNGPAEFLKLLGEDGCKQMTKITQKMYKTET